MQLPTEEVKKRLTQKDKNELCAYIKETFDSRKQKRAHLEKCWCEIDRQLAMEPDLRDKQKKDGTLIEDKAWLPEVELPMQSETLEISTADARRMQFPDIGPWFCAHTNTTDDYLDKVDFQPMISGDKNDVPSLITQDNADKIVYGLLEFWHRQYDFYGNMDYINAEAVKYSIGVGRARHVKKRVFMHTAKGVMRMDSMVPMLVPRSIKHTYLDDTPHSLMNEGYYVAPSIITEKTQFLKDLKIAAQGGDGWISAELNRLETDKTNQIQLLELEGDAVIDRQRGDDWFLANALITIAVGKGMPRVVRIRQNPIPGCSFITFPYHVEHIDSPYCTSPLMKGRPLHSFAVDILSRTHASATVNNDPPISYDRDDDTVPKVYPGALWPTTGEVKPHQIGDPAALFAIYQGMLAQYSDVTGVNAPRLGAQTVSHTTAYAKEAELSRGTVRVVDYVRNCLKGPLTQWLDIAFRIGKQGLGKTTYYIPQYNGFVTVNESLLPDEAIFEAYGSGGPQEEMQKKQMRIQSLQMALQMDQLGISMNKPPTIDIAAAIQQTLGEGGWTDIDAITNREGAAQAGAGAPGMGAAPEQDPGLAATTLQNLAYGGR